MNDVRTLKPGLLALLALALTVALTGCMAPKAAGNNATNPADLPPFVPGDVTRGQEVFKTGCATCHGQDAKGMFGQGPDLVKQSKWLKKQNDAMLLKYLKTQHEPPLAKNMTATDETLRDAITYLRTIQPKK
ncbi:MAG TPA: cytochrome c [Symbiobacteriaceae bacterium]